MLTFEEFQARQAEKEAALEARDVGPAKESQLKDLERSFSRPRRRETERVEFKVPKRQSNGFVA